MYTAKTKGHQSGGGGNLDRYTVEGLEAVWDTYFPGEQLSASDPKVLLAADLIGPFRESNVLLSLVDDDSSGVSFVPIDFQQLKELCGFIETELRESPKEALLCMGAAAHLAVYSIKKVDLFWINKINIRLYNYSEKAIALKELKAAYIKKIVTVCGTVLKVSTVKPLVAQLKFRCVKCAKEITRVFCDGKFSPPVSCDIPGCKSRTFTPERSTAKLIDFQKIRIQEFDSADNHEEGRVPRTVECELTEDLVDSCIPGEVVMVTGIVKVLSNYADVGGGKSKNRNKGLYYLYLEAISLRNLKSRAQEIAVENRKSHAVSDEEIRASGNFDFQNSNIRDLDIIVNCKQKHGTDMFRQLLQSLCPSIYGHELVKAGITLALFGGVQKNSMDRNKVPVRGDIHIVVVGDPGLGKSQLLQAAAAISPRGIYVCGNTTTRAGLTVAVVKDPMTNDFAFEAGAMVLADGGLCCIDEFDKMSAEHQALLEAMEQQCVSVAKAGLVASLSARTSVLAAANPVGGHYDRAKTVNENLKMNAALLSRFDLVFILLDKPDELLDRRVSDHIIALHANDEDHFKSNKRTKTVSQCHGDLEFGISANSFASRLRLHPEREKQFSPLAGRFIRKYISYAREHVHPRMSRAAADILQEFYLKLRERSPHADGTPITARQLESLVRLAEARARVDLREEVTVEDAKDVVEIMKESLHEKYVDEHGFVDFTRSGGMSQQKAAKKLLSALYKESESERKNCFSKTELRALGDKIGLLVPNLDNVIESLNNEGCLLHKGSGMYQVVAASYSQCQPTRSRW